MGAVKEKPSDFVARAEAFLSGLEVLGPWTAKWGVKAQLVERNVYALYGADSLVKVIAVPLVDDLLVAPAASAYCAREWAIRCAVNLAFLGPNSKVILKESDLTDFKRFLPFMSDNAGLVVDVSESTTRSD